jgi:hypothetical protein
MDPNFYNELYSQFAGQSFSDEFLKQYMAGCYSQMLSEMLAEQGLAYSYAPPAHVHTFVEVALPGGDGLWCVVCRAWKWR